MSLKQVLLDSSRFFLPKDIDNFLNTYIVGSNDSLFYVSYWSIVHFTSGLVFGFMISKFLITKNDSHPMNDYYLKAIILHTVWELWQIFIESTDISKPRGMIDTVVDTVFFMMGAFLYKTVLEKLI